MDKAEFTNFYWKYYLHLENEFINTTNFVMLDKNNFKTFSIEYQKLLLAIGSECEILFKELCGFDSDDGSKNINSFKAEIASSNLMGLDNNVRIMGAVTLDVLEPFGEEWPKETPKWWRRYNNVKHGRSMNYKEANLENVLNALASLYLLEEYLHKKVILEGEVDFISPESNLFTLSWKRKHSSMQKVTYEEVDSNYQAPLIDITKQEEM
ncbi:hypothetical protein [Enterococcus lactis]|uniref:Uncharacterized protein n=1 Tax=Enterococcus lactis TaxID=357441 RepID=A0AAJ1WCY0_9ENTE|nr:hypothetical protein [Enterococcus lactis]MDP8584126.1 hypothetical protein [Listeria innocua]MDP8590861.1 hypothetical protein [Enterococcus lactis]